MVRGKKRELPRKNVNVDVNAAIHNRFDVEVVDAATGRVKKKARAYNVICYQLWSRMFTPTTYFNYIHYGTGEGSPTQSDSKLFHFSGYLLPSTADDVYDYDVENYTYSLTRKVQINPEVAVGETITEVGIAYDKTEGTLCTHAMLQDMNGNPISIEKTATDLINIYATVYLHLPNDLENMTAWFIGYKKGEKTASYRDDIPKIALYALGMETMSFNNAQLNSGAYPRNSALVDEGANHSAISTEYVLSNRLVKLSVARYGVNSGNTDNGALFISISGESITAGSKNLSNNVCLLSVNKEWWAGTQITNEAIGTGDGATVDFATKFSFPEDATVKVDGVPVEATVEKVPLIWNDMGRYFLPVFSDTPSTPIISLFGGSTSNVTADNGETIFINPYAEYGIKTIYTSGVSMYASNDGKTWSERISSTVPEEYKKAKYWKAVQTGGASRYYAKDFTADTLTGKNIHFTEPPAEGAVITADYTTPVIAKDDQHVFDLTVTISFNPYEPV